MVILPTLYKFPLKHNMQTGLHHARTSKRKTTQSETQLQNMQEFAPLYNHIFYMMIKLIEWKLQLRQITLFISKYYIYLWSDICRLILVYTWFCSCLFVCFSCNIIFKSTCYNLLSSDKGNKFYFRHFYYYLTFLKLSTLLKIYW